MHTVKPPNLVPLKSRHFQGYKKIHTLFYSQEQHGGVGIVFLLPLINNPPGFI